MLETPHVLIGAAIATAIPDPAVALPLALASHFVTDYIPHWNPHLHTEKTQLGAYSTQSKVIVLVDAAVALGLGTLIAARALPDTGRFVTIMLACFLAVAPDVLEIPYYFLNMEIPWVKKLITWQRAHQWNVKPVWGILFQVIVILLSFMVIFARST